MKIILARNEKGHEDRKIETENERGGEMILTFLRQMYVLDNWSHVLHFLLLSFFHSIRPLLFMWW